MLWKGFRVDLDLRVAMQGVLHRFSTQKPGFESGLRWARAALRAVTCYELGHAGRRGVLQLKQSSFEPKVFSASANAPQRPGAFDGQSEFVKHPFR